MLTLNKWTIRDPPNRERGTFRKSSEFPIPIQHAVTPLGNLSRFTGRRGRGYWVIWTTYKYEEKRPKVQRIRGFSGASRDYP